MVAQKKNMNHSIVLKNCSGLNQNFERNKSLLGQIHFGLILKGHRSVGWLFNVKKQKWLSESVTEWVSDKVAYWIELSGDSL